MCTTLAFQKPMLSTELAGSEYTLLYSVPNVLSGFIPPKDNEWYQRRGSYNQFTKGTS